MNRRPVYITINTQVLHFAVSTVTVFYDIVGEVMLYFHHPLMFTSLESPNVSGLWKRCSMMILTSSSLYNISLDFTGTFLTTLQLRHIIAAECYHLANNSPYGRT